MMKRKFCLTPQPSDADVKRVENLAGLSLSTPSDPEEEDDVFSKAFAEVNCITNLHSRYFYVLFSHQDTSTAFRWLGERK